MSRKARHERRQVEYHAKKTLRRLAQDAERAGITLSASSHTATVSSTTISNVGDLYATTITPHDDTSHTDATTRRAERDAQREKAEQEPTVFQGLGPNPPPRPNPRSPLAQVFAQGMMLLADVLDTPRARIPRHPTRPDRRFTPKRPR